MYGNFPQAGSVQESLGSDQQRSFPVDENLSSLLYLLAVILAAFFQMWSLRFNVQAPVINTQRQDRQRKEAWFAKDEIYTISNV
jgi:hypothetical protein